MRQILHIISGLNVGGAETALFRLISGTSESDYVHSVVALTPADAMRDQFLAAGVNPIFLDFKKKPISQFFYLILLIRKVRPDIVQTWMYHADLFGGVAARIAGNRNVIWGVRTTDANVGNSRVTTRIRNVCARLSRWIPRAIVCAAEASYRSHAVCGYDSERMVVIPNGFDTSRLSASLEQRSLLRAECGFDQSNVVIGHLGRFNFAKDQENFVRAAGLLAKKYEHVRFLMVGRDVNEKNDTLLQWLDKAECIHKTVLLDERSDVAVCFFAMDIFCLSSRTEGFPNVLAEAMAMELPCVTTNVGDAAILAGNEAIVVPKENSLALAEGLEKLLVMSLEERYQLGKAGRERVEREFTMASTRQRFESLYEKIINGAKH